MLLIKRNSRATYKGKRVKILEIVGNSAEIRTIEKHRQTSGRLFHETFIVDVDELENIRPKPKEF